MRQVFASPRLENVESVAKLLRDAGIDTRITHGRSYKGRLRGEFSYRDHAREEPIPAVWVVKSEDQPKARDILREAGLLDSTRVQTSYALPVFRSQDAEPVRDPMQRRMFMIKMALLFGIVLVLVLAMARGCSQVRAPLLASPPFDGTIAATLEPVAQAVFASEIGNAKLPVLCLAIDDRDANAPLIDKVARLPHTTVPASHCQRVAASTPGSYYPKTNEPALFLEVHGFRPSAADAGTVEFSAYNNDGYGYYKTLAVKFANGHWQVVDTLKHVSMQG
jgi:hypothetical protein